MNILKKRLSLFLIAASFPFAVSQAQVVVTDWVGDGDNDLWSNALNWAGGDIPDSNTVRARFNLNDDVAINIDQDFTINRYIDGASGEGRTHTLFGEGLLTIDVNNSVVGESIGIDNATTGDGGTLRIGDGSILIHNSQGTATTMRNLNSSSNQILFDTGSTLTINTLFRTVSGAGGRIDFNGTFAPSPSNLQIGSSNVYFGEGHNSSEFDAEIVMLGNSKLTINGGTVLSSGNRFQLNGNGEIVLNAADTINGANIALGGANNLYLDVNADQSNFGHITVGGGTLTIDVDPDVDHLNFARSYFQNWDNGGVQITGFREGTIRFGTDGAGLNRDQLAAIAGGPYSLTAEGYLTLDEVSHWARFAIGDTGFVSLSPWMHLMAYVETAPFIWTEETEWLYMDEVVGVRGYGWAYSFDLELLDKTAVGTAGYGYSGTLNRWIYIPEESQGEVSGWFYIL